jgi:DNA topoisomerase-1
MSVSQLAGDPAAMGSIRDSGLQYVTDIAPGIVRKRIGASFVYRVGQQRVCDPATLERIRSLAVPPAWTDVWICPRTNGHIQATGRDAKDRKQYRYHARWREVRDETKYGRMLAFGEPCRGFVRQSTWISRSCASRDEKCSRQSYDCSNTR